MNHCNHQTKQSQTLQLNLYPFYQLLSSAIISTYDGSYKQPWRFFSLSLRPAETKLCDLIDEVSVCVFVCVSCFCLSSLEVDSILVFAKTLFFFLLLLLLILSATGQQSVVCIKFSENIEIPSNLVEFKLLFRLLLSTRFFHDEANSSGDLKNI